jgi:integrase
VQSLAGGLPPRLLLGVLKVRRIDPPYPPLYPPILALAPGGYLTSGVQPILVELGGGAMSKLAWKEPQSEALRKLWGMDLGEPRGLAEQIIMRNWRAILKDVCFGLSAEDIATKYGFSRRSFFYFLERRGLSFKAIEEACKEEREAREVAKRELLQLKQQRLKVIPSTVEEAMRDTFIQELVEDLRAGNVKEKTLARYLSCYIDLMKTLEKHIEDVTEEDLRSYVAMKIEQAKANGNNVDSPKFLYTFATQVLTPLRVLAKFKGLPIRKYLKIPEYEGMYRNVRITPQERYMIIKYLKEHYPRDYEALRGLLILAYETGSRAEGLWKGELIKVQKFGISIWIYRTEEKGKRAKIVWEKLIKPHWVEHIQPWLRKRKRYGSERVNRILKEAYMNVVEDGLTKEYAMEKPLHVWRHTACNDLLEETGYNLMIVSKRLGWKNPSMIVKVYGDISEEMLLSLSGYGIKVERAKHEFLYNEWLERAKQEGLL